MQCPKCHGEMEKGYLGDSYGDVGEGVKQLEWGRKFNFLGNLKEERKVETYCCTKCGYLESYAK